MQTQASQHRPRAHTRKVTSFREQLSALFLWLPLSLAADLRMMATAEQQHQRPFWSIGEGFEGSASDYAEYCVWLVGVIGVFYFLMNPNARRNLHAVDTDAPINRPPNEDEEEEFAANESSGEPRKED